MVARLTGVEGQRAGSVMHVSDTRDNRAGYGSGSASLHEWTMGDLARSWYSLMMGGQAERGGTDTGRRFLPLDERGRIGVRVC